jgi:hypothetical protein
MLPSIALLSPALPLTPLPYTVTLTPPTMSSATLPSGALSSDAPLYVKEGDNRQCAQRHGNTSSNRWTLAHCQPSGRPTSSDQFVFGGRFSFRGRWEAALLLWTTHVSSNGAMRAAARLCLQRPWHTPVQRAPSTSVRERWWRQVTKSSHNGRVSDGREIMGRVIVVVSPAAATLSRLARYS